MLDDDLIKSKVVSSLPLRTFLEINQSRPNAPCSVFIVPFPTLTDSISNCKLQNRVRMSLNKNGHFNSLIL